MKRDPLMLRDLLVPVEASSSTLNKNQKISKMILKLIPKTSSILKITRDYKLHLKLLMLWVAIMVKRKAKKLIYLHQLLSKKQSITKTKNILWEI